MADCAINLRAGHGWGPKDRVERTRLLTTTEGAAGQRPTIRFDRHPAMDKIGRFGHLTGILLRGRITLTTVAATMPAAMPGDNVFSFFQQMLLTAGGRQFLDNIDGQDLLDDMIIREAARVGVALVDPPDADATITRDLNLLWTFGRPHSGERLGARALDCAIPLSLFNAVRDQSAGLTFNIATTPTTGGSPSSAAFPGVTSTGFVTAGQELEIYAILRYEDEMHVDVPWVLKVVSGPERQSRDVSGALLGYAVIRDRANSTVDANQFTPNHTDYANVTFRCGDDLIVQGDDGLTAAIMAVRGGVVTALCQHASISGVGARVISPTVVEYLPLFWPTPAGRRAGFPNGDISWNFGTRSNHAGTRILIRAYGDYDMDYETKARSCTPTLGPDVERVVSSASPSAKAGSLKQLLPRAISSAPTVKAA